MGEFLLRQIDTETGAELLRFNAPNTLADEGLEYLLHRVFPPYGDAMTFQIGVCGVTAGYPDHRPNDGGGAGFGPGLTLAGCTGADANEGGCYTDAMRDSFGYARRDVVFAASIEADGGAIVSPEVTFANSHAWSPQSASAWDLPWTPEDIEQPPSPWTPKSSFEPIVGYPWQRPRKRSSDTCNPDNQTECRRSYMHEWAPDGTLNWLYDFRKMGGFPITMAFLADSSREKLIAAATFRVPVLLRPGTTLHVAYQARVYGSMLSRDFALRFAQLAFTTGGVPYDAIFCRPVLVGAPYPTPRTTYADLEPYFDPEFEPVALPDWTYVPGSRRVESTTTPAWTNEGDAVAGPFVHLAVYGTVGEDVELMWTTPIDPAATVPPGDTLHVPDGVRFQLESV